jgi:phage terminase large subunit-like protein
MAQFGLRLGIDPQAMLTTTPRPIKMLIDLLNDERTRVTSGHTLENQHNLSPKFLRTIMRKYAGTRLGKQELEAKLLTDTPGALWKQDNLDETRVRLIPEMSLIIIAIDPQANDPDQLRKNPELLEETAETGIVVAGRGMDGHFYVLEDASGHYTPKQWGHKAVELYDLYKAEKIIGEVNNGGAMVKYTVAVASKALGQEVFFKEVHASRGKRTRAEPVAALYEQHRAHHVGAFSDLESQMITWVPGLKSPDRMDAMVWAATESMLLAPDDLIFQ